MSFPKPKQSFGPAKGRVKCFKCRDLTMAKDGGWHQAELDNVFLCKPCGTTARAAVAPARKATVFAGNRS